MDPVTAAGLALSVAGLAGQVFAGCIQCTEFILAAKNMQKNCRYLSLRLRMEQSRLIAWAETSGLLEFDSENNQRVLESNAFGLHRSTVLELLIQIKVLFEEFETQQRRHKYLEICTPEDEKTLGNWTDSDERLEIVSPKRKVFIEKAMKAWVNTKGGTKRLRWVAFDKAAFEELLQKFSTLNDSITGLLDLKLQSEIHSTTQDTNRGVLQLAHDIADLQQLVKATLVLQMRAQPYTPSIAQFPEPDATHLSGLQLIRELARFKAFNAHLESDGSSSFDQSTADLLELTSSIGEGSGLSTFDTRLSKSLTKISHHSPPSSIESNRCEAIYTPPNAPAQHVWIEWKEYDSQRPGYLSPSHLIMDRVQKLAALLHHRPKPENFRVPHCIGYFDNASRNGEGGLGGEDEDSDSRIGFVFEKPFDVAPESAPISLLQLLRTEPKPRVTGRIALAQAVANCILYLHSVNWLHKGLRSHNIVFFASKEGKIEYNKPYLSGFDFARPACPDEQTELPDNNIEYNMYRHPLTQNRQAGPREAFRKSFDIYSLGVILVELAHWETVDRVLGIDLGGKTRQAQAVRERLLEAGELRELGACMGEVYETATRKCLKGGEELGIGRGDDETVCDVVAARLGMRFFEDVVKRLGEIRV